MTRLVERVVGWLPLESRARRAVDETLLDWRHEAGEARTGLGRVARNLVGLAAVARVVARAVVIETVHLPVWWLAPRIAIFAGLPAALALAYGLAFVKGIAAAPGIRPELVTSVTVGRLLPFLPLIMFMVVVWPGGRRHLPRLGLAVCAFVAVLWAGWILAATNEHMNVLTRDFVRAYQGGVSLHPPSFADLGWREILWRLVVPERFPPMDALVAISGTAAASAALVLLAGAVRTDSGRPRWMWIVVVPVGFVATVGGLFAALVVFHLRLGPFVYWAVAAIALAIALRLGRKSGEPALSVPLG